MKQDWTIYTFNYFAIFIAVFGFFMNLYILLPVIPLYASVLGVKEALIGLIVGTFTIAAVFARILIGPYSNRWPRGILGLGSTIFFFAPLLYVLSDSSLELLIIRLFNGIGMVFTLASMILIANLTPQSRLGEAMGIYGFFIVAAQAAGPALSGMLMDMVGFTGTFYVATGFALLSGLSGAFVKANWDSQAHLTSLSNVGYRKVLRNRNVLLASLGIFVLTITYGMLLAYGPLHLQKIGMSPTHLGLFFTLVAIGGMIGRPILGKLSDTKGRTPVIISTMLLTALCVYSFSEFVATNILFLMALFYGLGFWSAHSVQSTLVIETIDPQYRSSALAVFTAIFDFGFSIGSIGIGLIGNVVTFRYPLFFQITAGILVIGIGTFSYFSWQQIRL
ncbi:MAG: MFS transporter [Candidatus Heimdallarchaeota archaeon]